MPLSTRELRELEVEAELLEVLPELLRSASTCSILEAKMEGGNA